MSSRLGRKDLTGVEGPIRSEDRLQSVSPDCQQGTAIGAFQQVGTETVGVQIDFQMVLMFAVGTVHRILHD
jgi:hypothetical protein